MSLDSALAAYMKKLSGPALIEQLFTADFIESHTSCASAKEFFRGAGVVDQTTYDTWNYENANDYVRTHSDFDSWGDMFSAAAKLLMRTRQELLRSGDDISCSPVEQDPFSIIAVEINASAT